MIRGNSFAPAAATRTHTPALDQPRPPIPEPADPPATDPAASSSEFRLHPDAVRVWTSIAAVVLALPAIGGTIALLALGFWLLAALPIPAAAGFCWLLHRYYRRHAAALRCTLSPLGFSIARGVWWRSQTFVPRQRVQHTDVDQGPLARRHGMATLKVFTAGSEHSQIQVDGLRHKEAVRVRDDLIERDTGDRNGSDR